MSSSQPAEKQTPAAEVEAGEHVKAAPSSTAAAAAADTTKLKDEEMQDVPDPDEDDLDDLDDMLNDFSVGKQSAPATGGAVAQPKSEPLPDGTKTTTEAATAQPGAAEDAFSEEEFAKQLQAGMADLLGELEKSPDMQAQFEDMFKQMTAATGGAAGDKPESSTAAPTNEDASKSASAAEASFQETIRRTMERMQSSGDQATAAAASSAEEDLMSELMKQLSSGDLNGEGSEEEFSKMLMGMMDQLTNKEILYEPMKELSDKFPQWLEKNKANTPAEDLKRYEEQRVLASEIVGKFEESTYSDSNAADREYIVDRMQKMQAAGSPPSDLVGDMPSAQDAFNMPDEQCNPQ